MSAYQIYQKLLEKTYSYIQDLQYQLEDSYSYAVDTLSYYASDSPEQIALRADQQRLLEDIRKEQRFADLLESKLNQYPPF